MGVKSDSAGVRFPPPFVYLGALLLGLAAERFVPLRWFGIDWRLLAATGAAVRRRRGVNVCGCGAVPSAWHQRASVAANNPYRNDRPHRWTRNPMYLAMALIYASLAIGLDGPIALALLPLVLIAIQTRVIAREERYLEAKFGDEYRRYKTEVRRWF